MDNLDENYHYQFISEKLSELLTLLAEPDSVMSSDGEVISEEAVEALNLIFEGSMDNGRTMNSLTELLCTPKIFKQSGYIKIQQQSRLYRLRVLHSWMRSLLIANPYSVEQCIRSGKRLQWRLPTTPPASSASSSLLSSSSVGDSLSKQKIATNAHLMPRGSRSAGNKLVIMSAISHQIIARCSATLDGATLKIHRAYSSYLYLLSPMRSVTLEKCRKLTIVLGPIENTLQVNQCDDCLIVAPCRRLVLAGCRRCTFHLAIHSPPILTNPPQSAAVASGSTSSLFASSSHQPPPTRHRSASPATPTPSITSQAAAFGLNEEIIFAPFHTTYMRLTEHLARAHLNTRVNLWDRPFVLDPMATAASSHGGGGVSPTTNQQVHRCCWDLMQPAHFYPFNIPLRLPTTSSAPAGNRHLPMDGDLSASISRQLDLSAALVTNPPLGPNCQLASFADYAKSVSVRLTFPLPKPFLEALHQRALVYQSWPKQIATMRLTSDQRQQFGALVDQRFRQWLGQSSNLRQLQLLELTTSPSSNSASSLATGPIGGHHPHSNQHNSSSNGDVDNLQGHNGQSNSKGHHHQLVIPSVGGAE